MQNAANRKNDNIQHPQSRFLLPEKDFVEMYCQFFFGKATPGETFYQVPIVYTCDDHRVKAADDKKNEERSRKAKEEFEEKKKTLSDVVRLSDKDEIGYDDIIRDITDLLSREYIDRDEKPVGTSSKSLTTLFSNLGNWREVRIGFFLHSLTTRRSTTRKTNQMCIQIMFQRTTIYFCKRSEIWARIWCWIVKQARCCHTRNI